MTKTTKNEMTVLGALAVLVNNHPVSAEWLDAARCIIRKQYGGVVDKVLASTPGDFRRAAYAALKDHDLVV